MAYYDTIAKRWHESTGYKGGPFKEHVLNNILFEKIANIEGSAILELGAGNGYFLPLLIKRFSGQVPAEIAITDQSEKLLTIARRHFRVSNAIYQGLDISKRFPFEDASFDLVIASMVLNELPAQSLPLTLRECYRVLSFSGRLIVSVIHPAFIADLQARNLLKPGPHGTLTMPGTGSLRLPVVMRSTKDYQNAMQDAGFRYEEQEVFPTPEVLRLKGGLRKGNKVPLALIYTCSKTPTM